MSAPATRRRPSSSPGGGTAGHVSPLLALADCLRRREPDVRIVALGTEEGLEARLVPARGYDLEVVPKVPMPRRPSAALLRLPASLRRAVDAADAAIDHGRRPVVVGFGGYVSTPAYLAARRRGIPIVIHEQNARPGAGQQARLALRDARRGHLPRHPAARCDRHRYAVAPRDRAARPHGPPRRGPGALRPRPPVADRPRDRWVARRAADQRRLPGGRGDAAHRGRPGPARHRRRQGVRRRRRRRGCALRRRALRRPDGARLRRRRHRRRALRRQHGLRADRRRAARGLRPAARSATASSASTRGPSSPPAAGSSSRTPTSRPAWVEGTLVPLLRDASAPRRDGEAAASVGERDGDELLADLVVDAAGKG